MMEFIGWVLDIAWKATVLICGWSLFRFLIRDGRSTFKELISVFGTAIRVGCFRIRRKLIVDLKKEEEAKNEEPTVETVEGRVV